MQSQACFHQRIREELGPDTPVLAPGDFNDEPFDESLRLFAEASRERGLVERSRTAPRFTNLAWRFSPTEGTDRLGQKRRIYGTVSFNDCGLVFDQLLVSQGWLLGERGWKVREESARMGHLPAGWDIYPPMVHEDPREGPIRFGRPKGKPETVNLDGYSDHVPVSLVLEEASAP